MYTAVLMMVMSGASADANHCFSRHHRNDCCCAPVVTCSCSTVVVNGEKIGAPAAGTKSKGGAPLKISPEVQAMIDMDATIKKGLDAQDTRADKQKFIDGIQKTYDDVLKAAADKEKKKKKDTKDDKNKDKDSSRNLQTPGVDQADLSWELKRSILNREDRSAVLSRLRYRS